MELFDPLSGPARVAGRPHAHTLGRRQSRRRRKRHPQRPRRAYLRDRGRPDSSLGLAHRPRNPPGGQLAAARQDHHARRTLRRGRPRSRPQRRRAILKRRRGPRLHELHDESAVADSARDAAEPTVRLQGVSKRFGAKQAVYDLSLELYPGEVFAFLGPNGAGKTTTLKMTTGLLRSDTGSVTVCGCDMQTDGRAAKSCIAYVPDQPFLYDKLTGREFIRFACDMYGVSADEAAPRLAELTERLDMEPFLDQLSESYSHGMKQKVALAAALIHQPRLLVVDEPIVGLDPRTIRVIKDIFRERTAHGGTVFMSTHTLDVAEAIAHRIGIIHRGRLIALGTLDELRRNENEGRRLEDIFLLLTGSEPGAAEAVDG
ncbi:MAG: ABC transporter ATP-binding protein [Planctomycetota bacterium]|nr:MAG: ABC transporter ATP-binding protein [Planctomycetota bacterium]